MPGTWTQARLLLTRLSLALDRPAPAQPARHGGAAQAAARAAGRALQLPRHTRAGAVRGPTRTRTLTLTLPLTLALTLTLTLITVTLTLTLTLPLTLTLTLTLTRTDPLRVP